VLPFWEAVIEEPVRGGSAGPYYDGKRYDRRPANRSCSAAEWCGNANTFTCRSRTTRFELKSRADTASDDMLGARPDAADAKGRSRSAASLASNNARRVDAAHGVKEREFMLAGAEPSD